MSSAKRCSAITDNKKNVCLAACNYSMVARRLARSNMMKNKKVVICQVGVIHDIEEEDGSGCQK